jgi:predicted metal-dependent hydrolase
MHTYHPLYIQFFQHYHQGEYWEAHEVLEELWQQDRTNDFYHGLIQIAAIMHQLVRGKVRGARKLSTSAIGYLTPYAPKHEGVEVGSILKWLQFCLQKLPEEVMILETTELQKLGIPICQLPEIK